MVSIMHKPRLTKDRRAAHSALSNTTANISQKNSWIDLQIFSLLYSAENCKAWKKIIIKKKKRRERAGELWWDPSTTSLSRTFLSFSRSLSLIHTHTHIYIYTYTTRSLQADYVPTKDSLLILRYMVTAIHGRLARWIKSRACDVGEAK